jgi:hypothetical protein
MTKKKTTEEFIQDAISKHGTKYGYENVRYDGARVKVSITCFKHQDWMALPNDFLNGSGCPECGKESVANSRRKPEYVAREEIRQAHGDRYVYKEPLGYTNKNSKIDIFCYEHGWFSQSFHNHTANRAGCPKCNLKEQGDRCRKTLENFIQDANDVHGNRYQYHKVVYKNSEVKVEIICPEHESFWQAPGSHLSGRGCPYCSVSGFKGSQKGFLYVLTDGDMTKIGITNNNPEKRCKTVARYSGKDLKVLKTYSFVEGWRARKTETLILQELKSQYIQPLMPFDGWRECFYDVNLASLLNRIEQLISQQSKEQYSSNNQAAQAA